MKQAPEFFADIIAGLAERGLSAELVEERGPVAVLEAGTIWEFWNHGRTWAGCRRAADEGTSDLLALTALETDRDFVLGHRFHDGAEVAAAIAQAVTGANLPLGLAAA